MFDDTQNQVVDSSSTTEVVAAEQQAPVEQPKETQKEYNMRVLRERAESERKAREAAEKRIKELESQQGNYSAPQSTQSQDFSLGIDDNEVAEIKHVKQLLEAERKRNDERIQQLQRQAELDKADAILKSKYADFEQVFNKENMETLKMVQPSLYNSVISNRDPYSLGDAGYQIIKNFGLVDSPITQEAPRSAAPKPKNISAASMGPQTVDTPLARTGDYDRRILTEDDRRRKMEEVQRYKSARQ